MPDIIKATIGTFSAASGKKVVVITKDNYNHYIDLPAFMQERIRKKQIGLPHLSDYIRIALLCKYGGLWLDSTVFCASKTPQWVFEEDFFTIHASSRSHKYIPMGKWNMQVLGSSKTNCPVFVDMKRYLDFYWQNYKKEIDYLFFDYGMQLIYDNSDVCRKLMDAVPMTNERMHELLPILNKTYSEHEWLRLTQDGTWMFKLTYKGKLQESADGAETFYGHIVAR